MIHITIHSFESKNKHKKLTMGTKLTMEDAITVKLYNYKKTEHKKRNTYLKKSEKIKIKSNFI